MESDERLLKTRKQLVDFGGLMELLVVVEVAVLAGDTILGGELVSMRLGATPRGSANLKQVRLLLLWEVLLMLELLVEPFS